LYYSPDYSYPVNYHRGKAESRRDKKKKHCGSAFSSIKADTAELREISNQIPNMPKIHKLIGIVTYNKKNSTKKCGGQRWAYM
jgi:hypothetical protein